MPVSSTLQIFRATATGLSKLAEMVTFREKFLILSETFIGPVNPTVTVTAAHTHN